MSAHSLTEALVWLMFPQCCDGIPMARPPSIDREHLLRVARELFLRHGMALSVSEVARTCGVAEGTIFKHFGSKAELLRAAMELSPPDWVFRIGERVGRGEVEDELVELFGEMLDFFRCIVPLAMMSWSEPTLRAEMQNEGGATQPLEAHRGIAAYLEAEMALGRIVAGDSGALSMIISGALWNYCSMEVLFRVKAPPLPARDVYLASLARLVARAPERSGALPSPPNTSSRKVSGKS